MTRSGLWGQSIPVTTERAESLRQPISDVLREEIARRFSPGDRPRVTAALEEVGFLSDRELLAAVVLGGREGSGLWEALLRVQFERDVVLGKTGMDKDDWLEVARNDTFTLPFKLPRGWNRSVTHEPVLDSSVTTPSRESTHPVDSQVRRSQRRRRRWGGIAAGVFVLVALGAALSSRCASPACRSPSALPAAGAVDRHRPGAESEGSRRRV